jgi:hypothetical protein
MAKLGLYRSYNYIDKNPVIDKVRTVLQDENLFDKFGIVHELSNVAVSTMQGWFHGETKHPQHHTIAAVISALGYREEFVKTDKEWDLDKERKSAAAWRARQPKRSVKKKRKG